TARNSGTRLTSMERWAPIWETRPRETSVGPPRRRLRRSGLVAHLPTHLSEEPPLGRRETLDAPRRDLVEHTIDLGLGGVAVRRAPGLDARIAAARRATRRRVDQDAGLGGAPEMPLRPRHPQVRGLEIQEPRRESAQVREMGDLVARGDEGEHQRDPDRER